MPTRARLFIEPPARLLGQVGRGLLLGFPPSEAAPREVRRVGGVEVLAGLRPGRRLSHCSSVHRARRAVRSLRSGLAGELVDIPVAGMSGIMGPRNPAGQRVTDWCPFDIRASADGAFILGVRVTRPAVHKRCTLLGLVTLDRSFPWWALRRVTHTTPDASGADSSGTAPSWLRTGGLISGRAGSHRVPSDGAEAAWSMAVPW
jgi:hypothetical protein